MRQSQFNGMTAGERVAYTQSLTTRDMQNVREQIHAMHKSAIFERNLLVILAFISAVIISLAFHFLNPRSTLEFILLAIIAVVFVVGGIVAGNAARKQIAMMDGLEFLYSRLVQDTTVRFGMEVMQAGDIEARDVAIAWHMIDELIARIGKGNGERKKNGKPNSA